MTAAIRSARPDDYPHFLRLFPELGVPEPPPTAERFVEQLLPRALFATEAGEVAGYASWQVYGRAAHVLHVIVDRRRRRRGIGRALMDAIRTRVDAAGCTRWYLNVKRDNEAARRVYARCGLRVECEGWAVEMDWSSAEDLLDDGAEVTAFTPDVQQELAICARFGLESERLARRRGSGYIVPCALREGDSIAGFASFDPAFPGAFPFCVVRPELARPLLAAMKAHAHLASFRFVRLMVLGDRDLVAVLRGAGAEVTFELVQMGAPLGQPT